MAVKSVDEYLAKFPNYNEELNLLRSILLNFSELEETIKWGAPVYAVNGKNCIGIGAFKSYVGLWFFQGALLNDSSNLLVAATDSTKALRQIRFQSVHEIQSELLVPYINQAIENQLNNLEIKAETAKEYELHPLLSAAFSEFPKLKEAFYQLSFGKQKEYSTYLFEAKREETQQKRLEKIIPLIELQVGLNDKYKNC